MAKKKDIQEEENFEQTMTEMVEDVQKEQDKTIEDPQEKVKDNQEKVEDTPSEFIDKILQRFSKYDSLYIDQQGGVYRKNTNAKLVGNAKLYTNPYYKK